MSRISSSFLSSVPLFLLAASAIAADRPAFHRRIPHPAIVDPNEDAVGATFGWSMTLADVNGGTSLDELVVTSFFQDDDPFGSPVPEAGAAYAFHTRFLVPHPQPMLEPATPQSHQHLGRLYPAVGNPHEDPSGERLVFLGAIGSDLTIGGQPLTNAGTVEVFDLNVPPPSGPNVLSLVPPTAASDPGYPAGVAAFGHSIATGDVDGDGFDDLAVGAHDSELGTGRVYVFFSHSQFLTNPHRFWVGVKSTAGTTESFGASVALVDLDEDGLCELIVGATDRYAQPGTGRTYVYDGATINGLAKLDLHVVAEDQLLTPPAPYANDGQWFGWTLFDVGDMGGTDYAAGTSRNDLAVHAEATDWPGGGGLGSVPYAGALFVFMAWDASDPTPPANAPFLNPTPVVLQTPVVTDTGSVVHQPQTFSRFGRGAAPVEWQAGPDPVRGLLVGDPDAHVQDPNDAAYPNATPIDHAGRVFFFEAPLDGAGGTASDWGRFVLLEPADSLPEGGGVPPMAAMTNGSLAPRPSARFGAWIVSGKYNAFLDHDQFVVSARRRSLPGASEAGQVYTFTWPDPTP